MNRIRRVLECGAAIVHAELTVAGRIPNIAVVAQNRVLDSHQVEQPLDLAQVSDCVTVEAADEVQFAIGLALQFGRSAGFAIPEVFDDALEHVVVAGDMAANKCRRVRKGYIEFHGNRSLFLRILDEAIEIVADHFSHAGCRYGDHLWLVKAVRIG